MIKNIKKASSTPVVTCFLNGHPTYENILPIGTPFSGIEKSFRATI